MDGEHGLSARRDHRPAWHVRHVRRSSRRLRASSRQLHATDRTDAWGLEILRIMQPLSLHRATVPSASGVSTARDMARFYAALAAGGALDGARILQQETVARMLRVEVDGEIDRTFDVPVRRGLGLSGRSSRPTPALARCDEYCAHLLARRYGSSVCWGEADLDWRWPSSAMACGGMKPGPSLAVTFRTRYESRFDSAKARLRGCTVSRWRATVQPQMTPRALSGQMPPCTENDRSSS